MLICGGKFSQKKMRIDHRKFRVHLQHNVIKFYCNMFHQFSKKKRGIGKIVQKFEVSEFFFFVKKLFFWNISLQKNLKKSSYLGRLLVHLRSSPHGVIPLGRSDEQPGNLDEICRPWTNSWPCYLGKLTLGRPRNFSRSRTQKSFCSIPPNPQLARTCALCCFSTRCENKTTISVWGERWKGICWFFVPGK